MGTFERGKLICFQVGQFDLMRLETRAKVSPNPQKQEPIKKLLRTISNSKNMNQESLASRYTRILGVVAAYWFVSITLVFVNKTLLSGGSSLNAPLFITWYQCAVTAAA